MTMTRTARLFWTGLERLVLGVFVCMLILVVAQVFFRYVLKISVPWTEEAARWFYVWQIFLGSILAMQQRLHLRATFLQERLPPGLQGLFDLVTGLAGLVFLAGILWGSVVMMRTVYPVLAGSFNIRMTYLYLALPVSLALMIYLTLKDVVAGCQAVRRRLRGNGTP